MVALETNLPLLSLSLFCYDSDDDDGFVVVVVDAVVVDTVSIVAVGVDACDDDSVGAGDGEVIAAAMVER